MEPLEDRAKLSPEQREMVIRRVEQRRADAGFVAPELFALRREQCLQCPYFRSGKCLAAENPDDFKALKKAMDKDSSCPENKWPEAENTEV